jgi:DNA-binding transcriptional MocR family regulator
MTEGLDLHLGVDKAAGFVGRALETALREAIRSGRLHRGARLPGSRSLAADLGISRGTVVQAYTQLIAEGWLTGREDGFLGEDDYGGEFRYDQQPVGAMQALAPDRVVFAGSTSKTLALEALAEVVQGI